MRRNFLQELKSGSKLFQKFHIKAMSERNILSKKFVYRIKEYPRFDKIILPPPKKEKNIGKSDFLSLISLLFYKSYYLNPLLNKIKYPLIHTSGSPMEIYLVSIKTEIPEGFYHYNRRQHLLEILPNLSSNGIKRNLKVSQKTQFLICISAIFEDVMNRYGERGYQLILKEVGYLTEKILSNNYLNRVKANILEFYDEKKYDELFCLNHQTETIMQVIAFEY